MLTLHDSPGCYALGPAQPFGTYRSPHPVRHRYSPFSVPLLPFSVPLCAFLVPLLPFLVPLLSFWVSLCPFFVRVPATGGH